MFSNFECVNLSIIFRYNSIVLVYISWSLFNWEVINTINFNSFSFILGNGNEIFIIHSDDGLFSTDWLLLLNWNFFRRSWLSRWFLRIWSRNCVGYWLCSDNFSVSISSISWLNRDKDVSFFAFWSTSAPKFFIFNLHKALALISLGPAWAHTRLVVFFENISLSERSNVLV